MTTDKDSENQLFQREMMFRHEVQYQAKNLHKLYDTAVHFRKNILTMKVPLELTVPRQISKVYYRD